MGVISPLISTNIITIKNITNIACCIVSDMFASTTPQPAPTPKLNYATLTDYTHFSNSIGLRSKEIVPPSKSSDTAGMIGLRYKDMLAIMKKRLTKK